MRVHIAADHAGFELREYLIEELTKLGYEMVDHGAKEYDALDAYPTMCIPCAEAVAKEPDSLGIVLGGSGNGEQMAANLVDGVRSALVWNEDTAALAREHNNSNVISIGARQHSKEEALKFVKIFLETKFSDEPRHQERINLMKEYEDNRCK